MVKAAGVEGCLMAADRRDGSRGDAGGRFERRVALGPSTATRGRGGVQDAQQAVAIGSTPPWGPQRARILTGPPRVIVHGTLVIPIGPI